MGLYSGGLIFGGEFVLVSRGLIFGGGAYIRRGAYIRDFTVYVKFTKTSDANLIISL